MSERSEQDKEDDLSLAGLDAIADQWAEEINLTAMIKNMVSPMRLTRNAPNDTTNPPRDFFA